MDPFLEGEGFVASVPQYYGMSYWDPEEMRMLITEEAEISKRGTGLLNRSGF